MRLSVVCMFAAVVGLGLIAPSGASAANTGRTYVPNCSGKSTYKPANLVLACADANLSLDKLKWKTLSSAKAQVTGKLTYNDCKPNCAAGKFHSVPTTAVFSKPKQCKATGKLQFTKAVISAPDAPQVFRKITQDLSCGKENSN